MVFGGHLIVNRVDELLYRLPLTCRSSFADVIDFALELSKRFVGICVAFTVSAILVDRFPCGGEGSQCSGRSAERCDRNPRSVELAKNRRETGAYRRQCDTRGADSQQMIGESS